jgi:hypothetical protein
VSGCVYVLYSSKRSLFTRCYVKSINFIFVESVTDAVSADLDLSIYVTHAAHVSHDPRDTSGDRRGTHQRAAMTTLHLEEGPSTDTGSALSR